MQGLLKNGPVRNAIIIYRTHTTRDTQIAGHIATQNTVIRTLIVPIGQTRPRIALSPRSSLQRAADIVGVRDTFTTTANLRRKYILPLEFGG